MTEYKSMAQMSPKEIEAWRAVRWKCRTDLGYLCRNILGYKHVSDNMYQAGSAIDEGPHLPIHQPLIDTVQKFPVPTPEQFLSHDQMVNGRWLYKPLTPLTRLPGSRRTLILDFRGSLKTTINTMAHAIQWIINYPDVAIMVVQSNGAKAEAFIGEIKAHFIGNLKFRQIFPEHCPQGNQVNEFGTRTYFTTKARTPGVIRKEPTILASSIDKGMAGFHFDVIKCSDIVDPSNINGQGLQDVKRSFNYLKPLLVSPNYYIDVEGTRYHSDDTYGSIIESELNSPVEEREYKMYIRSCYQRITPDGKPQHFTPEELKYPFKLGPDGHPLSWWPERFKTSDYEKMKRDDPFVFATQQLNDPSAAGGDKPFPVSSRDVVTKEQIPIDFGKTKTCYPAYISRATYKENISVQYREIIVDTAETNNKRSDYTVLTVVAWDADFGRVWVEEIQRGRFLPDQIISWIINLSLKYSPRKVRIEETAFVRGLWSSLMRKVESVQALQGVHIPVEPLKRMNQEAKTDRIKNALQPWYMSRDIRFLDDLDSKCPGVIHALENELDTFPAGKNDDILDTLSDIFQGKKHFGRGPKERFLLSTQSQLLHMQQQALKQMLEGPPPGFEDAFVGGYTGANNSGYEL